MTMPDICEYKNCEETAVRHFWSHYFCNEHNRELRENVSILQPDSLDEFIEPHLEQ